MIPRQISGAWDNLLDFLLPRICCGCGDRVINQKWLVCESCLDAIPPLHLPICPLCGCPDAFIKPNGRCRNCPPGKLWFSRARGSANYGGLPQLLVEKLKYEGRLEYAPLMALAMARLVQSDVQSPDVIVPVPLHRARQRERGFNQSAIIARHFARYTNGFVEDSILQRIVPTMSQTRLKRRQRRANIAGAFKCARPELVGGLHVLVIDDVYTTGSTLNECAKTLIDAGAASVECLAYARAILD